MNPSVRAGVIKPAPLPIVAFLLGGVDTITPPGGNRLTNRFTGNFMIRLTVFSLILRWHGRPRVAAKHSLGSAIHPRIDPVTLPLADSQHPRCLHHRQLASKHSV